jgi:hypothetical protein
MINSKEEKQVICTQMYQSFFEFFLFSLVTSHYTEICGYALYLYLHLIRETPIFSFPFMPLFQFVKIKVFKCVVYAIPLFTQRPVSAGTTSELAFAFAFQNYISTAEVVEALGSAMD